MNKRNFFSAARPLKLAATLLAGALTLSACVSPVAGPKGRYALPIGNAPVIANPTPYTKGLICLSEYAQRANAENPRIAVGRILDYTGQVDIQGGRRVTQGASLMAISAFAKSGARLVERFDTSVSELELKYANNKLIGEDSAQAPFRQINAGSIPGSDYYLVGGITELNQNIRSSAADLSLGDVDVLDPVGNGSVRLFVINVGVDLRLVETQSLEVVDVISFQKQIIGREVSAGVFDFFGSSFIFDASVAERAQEPVQLAIRSVIERAVLEMMANLYGAPSDDVCEAIQEITSTAGPTGNYRANIDDISQNNGATRADDDTWHKKRSKPVRRSLRGLAEDDSAIVNTAAATAEATNQWTPAPSQSVQATAANAPAHTGSTIATSQTTTSLPANPAASQSGLGNTSIAAPVATRTNRPFRLVTDPNSQLITDNSSLGSTLGQIEQ
ncbi:MAG: holdfast anchoring protein HfaB [Pseudomonadota bacterium]